MSKIKFISFFLLLLMTLQMLPIAQFGCMLGFNQLTEELPYGAEEDTGKSETIKFPSSLPPEQYRYASELSLSQAIIRTHNSAIIPTNHSSEIVSPPPDEA